MKLLEFFLASSFPIFFEKTFYLEIIPNLQKKNKKQNSIKNAHTYHLPRFIHCQPFCSFAYFLSSLSHSLHFPPFSLVCIQFNWINVIVPVSKLCLSPIHFQVTVTWPGVKVFMNQLWVRCGFQESLIERGDSDNNVFVWRYRCWKNTYQTLNWLWQQDPNLSFFFFSSQGKQ